MLIQLWKLFSRFANGLFGNKWIKVKERAGGAGGGEQGRVKGFSFTFLELCSSSTPSPTTT